MKLYVDTSAWPKLVAVLPLIIIYNLVNLDNDEKCRMSWLKSPPCAGKELNGKLNFSLAWRLLIFAFAGTMVEL